MNKLLTSLVLATVCSTTSVHAEEIIFLKDNSPILGKWLMYAETAALHKSKKEVKNEWEFAKDGLYVASRDPRLDSIQRIKVKYSVEEGVIKKQFQPGREKYESCKVIVLNSSDMTLHCKFNYYLFKKM